MFLLALKLYYAASRFLETQNYVGYFFNLRCLIANTMQYWLSLEYKAYLQMLQLEILFHLLDVNNLQRELQPQRSEIELLSCKQ